MSNENFGGAAPAGQGAQPGGQGTPTGHGTGTAAYPQSPPPGPPQSPAPPPPGSNGGDWNPPGSTAPRPPMDPKKKKKLTLLAILGGVLVLLLAAGIATYSYLAKNVYGAEGVVEEYLGALKDGNAEKAVELLPAGDGLDTVLINNEVYQAAENRISEYRITGFDGANGGVVTADVTRAGSTAEHTIRVVKDGRQNLLFPKWKIEDDLMDWSVTLDIPENSYRPQEMTVNGVTVALPEFKDDGGLQTVDLAVLPGDYRIEPIAGSKFINYGENETVEVELDSPQQIISYWPKLSDDADEALKTEMTAWLDSCLASTKLVNPGCLNNVPDMQYPERYRNIKWSLASGPSIDPVAGTTALDETFGFLATDMKITLNCEVNRGGNGKWEPFEESDTFTEFAEAKIDGDKLELIFE
ncbi:hypothetical protein MUK71_16060 [Arthrobacter zhangbolii]|uniref:Uncharacterized protein n=1 Tax=Arthrobacter zhangbolii TaxID=2886936 RepID=A0A9X1M715_9MICC|nr:hypothetical protein [Arthrobacter zhangbolii]MCC3272057.1 hypothetical protein [Arthrobacter zhangbolii]UON92068.1 hypothetical protein MUK71_16060 [Arthrobacter zhangbolii]